MLKREANTMQEMMKKSCIWSGVYLIVEFILIYLFQFVLNEKFLYLGIVGIIYILIHLFFLKYRREWLFINGILSFLSVVLLGILIGKDLKLDGVVAIGAAISVVDGLSFTKYGKKTTNAKAMSNIKFMSKLIVYGKGEKEALYPTCGIGDYFYFALWLSGLSKSSSMLVALGVALFTGNVINKIIIYKIHTRENYKGIPATIIPFVCVIAVYFIAGYR